MNDTPERLKCRCTNCSQQLEFPTEQIGQEIECPGCRMTTTLYRPASIPPPSPGNFGKAMTSAQKGRNPIILTLAIILIVAVPILGYQAWRSHVEKTEAAALRIEENFRLADAYKSAPASYNGDIQKTRLYGRIGWADLPDATNCFAAMTAQSLDQYLGAVQECGDRISNMKSQIKSKVDAYYVQTSAVFNEMPAFGPVDKSNREEAHLQATVEYESTLRDKTVKEANDLIKGVDEVIRNLVGDQKGFFLARDTRIRVEDISGHYAKIFVLDGEHRSGTAFVTPDSILVK